VSLDEPFCSTHQLVESECPWCTSDLIEQMGSCVGHGVPEALCSRCNETLIPGFKAENDWCAGHDLPESQCVLCHPDLLDDPGQETASHASSPVESPIQVVPNQHFIRVNAASSPLCETEKLLIQFHTDRTAEKAGLAYEEVYVRSIDGHISCYAQLDYDRNHFAHLSSRAGGVVISIHRNLGDWVEEGELIAEIDAIELGSAKSELLHAKALVDLWRSHVERRQKLHKSNIATKVDVLEAETALAEHRVHMAKAEQQLRNLGLNQVEIEDVYKNEDHSSRLPMLAPYSGMIVDRDLVLGEVVDAGQNLISLADTTGMWADLHVSQADLSNIRYGQTVRVQLEAIPGREFSGEIIWIDTQVDPANRMVRLRVELPNQHGQLKAGMFGTGRIETAPRDQMLVVPKPSVQWDGCCNVVFVQKRPDIYQPKKIEIQHEGSTYYAVSGTLQPGDRVVTTGSFLLKTEIQKGNIGAGCCEVEPGR